MPMNYFLERLKEPSSWRGLVMLATSIGLVISPEMGTAIVALGTGIAGVIGMTAPNKIKVAE